MKSQRKAYEREFDAKLKEYNAKIALLKAKAGNAEADAKIDYLKTIEALEYKQRETKTRLQELKTVGDEAWEAVKAGAEKAWAEVKTASSTAAQAVSRRILVVDDDKSIRDVVSQALEFMGFEVALAANGIEALAVFLETSFDLVLTDLQMPVMDGLSLASHIKEQSPSTPVILVTGSDRETVGKKMEGAPVDSVIFKPFRLKDLQRTVHGALASRDSEQGSVGVD